MAGNPFKHKWQKITAATVLTLTAIVLILGLLVNSYWSPVLAGKVKEIVLKGSDSLYTVDFSSAELHVLQGTIVIHNITLKPDTALYRRLQKLNLAPNNLIQLHVKRLIISHMHPFTLYFRNKLDIGEIVLNEPELKVSYFKNQVKETAIKDNRTMWQKMSKTLRSIHIAEILLGDVKFKYEDYSGNKVGASELKEMNLSAYDLLIDSSTQRDKSRLLYCKNIIGELNNYEGTTASGLYSYKVKSIKLSTSKSQLNITGLLLKPVSVNAFFDKSTNDRFYLRIDSIVLNRFNFLHYQKYRILSASDLNIDGGAVQIFSNPNKSNNRSDRITTFPNVALKNMKSDISIDSLFFKRINVEYNEFNKKSGETGSVKFNNTSGRVLNLTSNATALQKNNICSVQILSYFMNRAKLNLNLKFNLTDDDDSFTYAGTLGPMDLKYVNPAAMPLGMVKITTGKLKKFSFDIRADRMDDKGKVELLYNNVTVVLLKPDSLMNNLKRKPIATLFANLFIVKHDNPDVAGSLPRIAYVRYTRTRETPFFKSVWQTLFMGIKPCAGFDTKKQKDVIELTNQQAIKKANRKIKKAERIKRREARRKRREEKKLQSTAQQSTP